MGAVTAAQVEAALAHQRGRAMRIGEALVAMGAADESAVARALAKQAGLPFVDLAKGKVSKAILDRVPGELAREYGVLPVLERNGRITVAIDDPLKVHLVDNLRFVVAAEIDCAVAAPAALKRALAAAYGKEEAPAPPGAPAGEAKEEGEDAPIIRLVRRMVEEALESRASDIHVEPFADRLRVRTRIDGLLREVAEHPPSLHPPLLSRLKIMASMDIAEKRRPQDGRIAMRVAGREIDIRASVLPGNHGETFVMRLLDREANLLTLADLGLHGDDEARLRRILARPNGLVLVTGPTGSGKTTTLYAALSFLNRPDVKILTAEDPVEYHIRGINQTLVKPKIGLTFARILRAMLRQAPNVILVGEIRDKETAEVAIQAALTGHLVFSTLHTNDAPSAITRLVDMGVPPFLVAAGLQAILAQRLVRLLCETCAQPLPPSSSLARILGVPPGSLEGRKLRREKGCASCGGTGYFGRKALFEILEVDAGLREGIYAGEPLSRLRDRARAAGRYSTLYEDGVRKVLEGRLTVEELLRVTRAAEEAAPAAAPAPGEAGPTGAEAGPGADGGR
jgi:type II secretory ATPase GspE/PulE/Tfp pilus assembly ATPase PilB-like protein